MEGPALHRSIPRTMLNATIDLRFGRKKIHLHRVTGNLSPRGVYLPAKGLKVSAPVRIKFAFAKPLEVEGVVRFVRPDGIGVEFTGLSQQAHHRLDDLIAWLVPREILAS